MADPSPSAPRGRLPMLVILVTVVIEAMGIGLIIPVLPTLLREVRGVALSDAALWGGLLSASYALMQFLFAPLLGALSDRFGRRPVLLGSLAALFLDYILMAVAGTVWLLLLGRVIAGIAAATFSTAAAYVADISRPEEKTARFGLVSAAFGVGFVLGPAMGGVLAEFGPRAPFWAAAALAGANLALGLAALPETLRAPRALDWRRANPLGGLRAVGRLPGLGGLLALWVLFQVANWSYASVWPYFTQAAFGWGERMVGVSLALYGIATVVVQGGLIRLVLPRLGERRMLAWFIPYNLAVLLAVAFVPQGWMLLLLTPLTAIGVMVTPAIQGLASRLAADDRQGELQGVLASLTAVAAVASPLLMTRTFNLATTPPPGFPGAPFLLAAAIMAGTWGVYLWQARRLARAGDAAQA